MPATYPMLLDVAAMRVVVVGGGGVAKRKVGGLVDAGATDVTVVSPALIDGFPPVTHVAAAYSAEAIAGARLVFAATNDPDVNAAVVADARAIGALVCRADAVSDMADAEDARGDFVTPAAFREGAVIVTVSAGSAALTAAVRDGLRGRFDPRWAMMAEAMKIVRPVLRDRAGLTPAARAAAFRKLATDEAMAVLERGGTAGLLAWVGVAE